MTASIASSRGEPMPGGTCTHENNHAFTAHGGVSMIIYGAQAGVTPEQAHEFRQNCFHLYNLYYSSHNPPTGQERRAERLATLSHNTYIHVISDPNANIPEIARTLAGTDDIDIIEIDSRRCRWVCSLYSTMKRVLEFPDYFGRNWNALDECITDLSWLPQRGRVLVLGRADHLLSRARSSQFTILLEVLHDAAIAWSEQPQQRSDDETETFPFHVLLRTAPDKRDGLATRLQATGVRFSMDA